MYISIFRAACFAFVGACDEVNTKMQKAIIFLSRSTFDIVAFWNMYTHMSFC